MCAPRPEIPGITILDDAPARTGYALNKMFMSFNDAANRTEFLRDEDAYCARYGLNEHQCDAIRRRDVLALVAAGGNAYYLARFTGILGLDMRDREAHQTGMTKDAFRAMLMAGG